MKSRVPGVAVVLTDLLDPGGYADGLKALLQRRLEVFVLHVVSEEELNPSLGGDLTLVDAEGGSAREVSVDRWALDRYRERLQATSTRPNASAPGMGSTTYAPPPRCPFKT